MKVPESVFAQAVLARKNAAGPEFDRFRDFLRSRCEAHLTPGDDEYVDCEERKSEWWTGRMGCRFIPRAVEHLTFGGILFDAKYTRAAWKILDTVIEHRIAEKATVVNGKGDRHTGWRHSVLDAGAASVSLALSFDLIRTGLSREENDRLAEFLLPFFDYLLANPPDLEERKPEWNIASTAMTGLGMLALSFRAARRLDEERFKRATQMGKHRAGLRLKRFVDSGGAFLEGPGYGTSAIEYVALYARALAECGDRELLEHPAWALAAEGLVSEMIPATGQLNPLNDCNGTYAVAWLAQTASTFRNGLAQWAWQNLTRWNGEFELEPLSKRQWRAQVTRYLLYHDPDVKPLSPEEARLPKARHFPVRDLIDVRTGWKEDDAFVSFVCDHSPRGGHRQADRGQFAFFALGESFAIDSGYGTEESRTGGSLRTGSLGEAHNLPLIHGEMQHEMPAAGGLTRVELDRAVPYAEAEVGASWISAQRATRRITFLPPEGGAGACLVVGDRMVFRPMATPRLTWLLHTDASNRTKIEGDRTLLKGGRKGNGCLVQIVTTHAGRWKEEPFLEHTRLRYDWFGDPLLCLTVLAAYRAGEAPPKVATAGLEEGCVLRIDRNSGAEIFLSATPGRRLRYEEIETDAEFAHLRIERGAAKVVTVSAATVLKFRERDLA